MASDQPEMPREAGDRKAPLSSGIPPAAEARSKSEASLPENLLRQVGTALNRVAGTEKLEGFSFGEMFSETFKRRTVEEMEAYLIVGTARTTPPIGEVQTGWPKPWLFARCLLVFGLAYLGFVAAFEQFGSLDLVPGLLIMGAFAAPMSTLVLFFEFNTPRNVSLYSLIVLVTWGGIVASFFSPAGHTFNPLNWLLVELKQSS
jgi:RsiW-degrading membrane proteinase PrsW (M82 family)